MPSFRSWFINVAVLVSKLFMLDQSLIRGRTHVEPRAVFRLDRRGHMRMPGKIALHFGQFFAVILIEDGTFVAFT